MGMTPEQIRAVLFCTFVSASYVISLYLIPSEIRKLPRDNSRHIRYRMVYSTASTLQSTFLLYFLSRPGSGYVTIPGLSCLVYILFMQASCSIQFLYLIHSSLSELYGSCSYCCCTTGDTYFESIGLKLENMLSSAFTTLMLMSIFYLGPLVVSAAMVIICMGYEVLPSGELKAKESRSNPAIELYKQAQEYCKSTIVSIRDEYGFLCITRNLIFAPITEEIAFRSMMIPVLYAAFTAAADGSSSSNGFYMAPVQIALLSPAYFALAHIHHIIEKSRGGMPLKIAVLQVTVQLTYTSIFGVIAALIFMRTYSIAGPILSHFICNVCGLPDMDFTKPPNSRYASQTSCLYNYRYLLLFLHAFGLVMFSLVLFPLTESQAKHSMLYH